MRGGFPVQKGVLAIYHLLFTNDLRGRVHLISRRLSPPPAWAGSGIPGRMARATSAPQQSHATRTAPRVVKMKQARCTHSHTPDPAHAQPHPMCQCGRMSSTSRESDSRSSERLSCEGESMGSRACEGRTAGRVKAAGGARHDARPPPPPPPAMLPPAAPRARAMPSSSSRSGRSPISVSARSAAEEIGFVRMGFVMVTIGVAVGAAADEDAAPLAPPPRPARRLPPSLVGSPVGSPVGLP